MSADVIVVVVVVSVARCDCARFSFFQTLLQHYATMTVFIFSACTVHWSIAPLPPEHCTAHPIILSHQLPDNGEKIRKGDFEYTCISGEWVHQVLQNVWSQIGNRPNWSLIAYCWGGVAPTQWLCFLWKKRKRGRPFLIDQVYCYCARCCSSFLLIMALMVKKIVNNVYRQRYRVKPDGRRLTVSRQNRQCRSSNAPKDCCWPELMITSDQPSTVLTHQTQRYVLLCCPSSSSPPSPPSPVSDCQARVFFLSFFPFPSFLLVCSRSKSSRSCTACAAQLLMTLLACTTTTPSNRYNDR